MLRSKHKKQPVQRKRNNSIRKLGQDMENAVRIFPFQLFDNRTEIDLQPISAESLGNRLFVIPTLSEKIQLYGIEEEIKDNKNLTHCTLISEFDIVSESRSVCYMNKTDWLVSLEKHQAKKTVARIYFNWRNKGIKYSCIPERDFTGEIRSFSISQIDNDNKDNLLYSNDDEYTRHYLGVDYIEFPSDVNIRRVSTCPTSNRIAFATRNNIHVWLYWNNKMELLYSLKVDFDIERIDIFDEYLAYASNSEVRVVKICVSKYIEQTTIVTENIIIDETDPYQSSPLDPFTPVEDDHMIECIFNSSGNTVDPKRNIIIPSMGITKKKQGISSSTSLTFEVLGPTVNNHSVIPNKFLQYSLDSCTCLIHRQFSSNSWVHSLYFLPEYHLVPEQLEYNSNPKDKHERLLKNIKKQTKMDETEIYSDKKRTLTHINQAHSIRCMIGTSRNGYLYNISDPRLLCEYSFTEHTFACKLTSTIMYTLTRSSLIMWSIRGCNSAGEKFPDPCVMGLEPIPTPRHLIIIDDYILVTPKFDFSKEDEYSLSKANNNNSVLLKFKSLLALYEDVKEFALLNEKTSYEAYFQLMLELHFLLEAKLQSLNQRLMQTEYYQSLYNKSHNKDNKDNKNNHNINIIKLDPEIEQELHQIQLESTLFYEKHKESSAALGDYQFRTELYSRAAVFYAESNRLMSCVIEPMLAATSEDTKSSSRRAIINYLDSILFDKDKKFIIDETPDICDKILAIYFSFARSKVASVILDSQLSQYNQETAIRLLEEPNTEESNNIKKIKRYSHQSAPSIENNIKALLPQKKGLSAKNIFVRGLLYLDLGYYDNAKKDFLSLEPELLVEFCIQNPKLFNLDKDKNIQSGILPGISVFYNNKIKKKSLGQFLYEIDPWPLLDILIQINDYIPDYIGIEILCGNNYNTLSEDLLFLLEIYLEWLLLHSNNKSDKGFEILTLIYAHYILNNNNDIPKPSSLTISHPNRNIIRQKYIEIYRSTFIHDRSDWLNHIPPFDSINVFESRSPFSSIDEPLPEMFYLRKLQGLLSTKGLLYSLHIHPLLDLINNNDNFIGKLSLQLLCYPLADELMKAIILITEQSSLITCSYAAKYCITNEQWKLVLDYLSQSSSSYKVYTEIISHLVKTQKPENFVSLLPENGNMKYFLPFIEQCFRYHYAYLLKKSIVEQSKNKVYKQ